MNLKLTFYREYKYTIFHAHVEVGVSGNSCIYNDIVHCSTDTIVFIIDSFFIGVFLHLQSC